VTTAPYATNWDTTAAAAGGHTLTAVARDAAGHSTTSTPVTVTVDNSGPPPPPHVLVGDSTIEAQKDSNAAGRAEAFKTTATGTGSITSLSVYLDSTSTASKVLVGIYSDSGGHPGTLLAQATISAPVAGAWNTLAIPSVAVASGSIYWMAILGPTGSGTVHFRDKAAGTSETSSQSTLTSLPASWSTGSRYPDGPLSAYATGS
jgi:hypothetical protein